MFYLSAFCGVCLNKQEQYRTILCTNSDYAQLKHKLHTCAFVTDFLDINTSLHICNKCLDTLEVAYEFLDMCRKNSVTLRGYVEQLSHVSASTQHQTELTEQSHIKQEYVDDYTTEQIVNQSEYLQPEPYHEFIDLTSESGELLNEEEEILEEQYIDDEEVYQTGRVEQNDIKQEHIHEYNTEQFLNQSEYPYFEPAQMYSEPVQDLTLNVDKLKEEVSISEEESVILEEKEQCTVKKEIFTDFDIESQQLQCMNANVGSTVDQQTVVPTIDVNDILSDEAYYKNKCNFCEKIFTTLNALKTHMLVHKGRNNYQCINCAKRFTHFSYLKIHMVSHTDERKFQCTLCENTYKQPWHLKSHMLSHSGERKYQCTVCEKRFIRSDTLNVHMRIHARDNKSVK